MADNYRASITGTDRFTGTASLDDAIMLARRGWPDGLKTIERLRAEIDKALAGKVPVNEPSFDISGDWLDVGRYLSGEPENFGTMVDYGKRTDAPIASIIRLVVNVATSAPIGEQTTLTRGAAAIVLVDMLERHGIRVRVDLVDVTTNHTKTEALENYVTVKEEGEPVNLDKLAFFLAHRSSLRRLFFSVAEHQPDSVRRLFGIGQDFGSYGLPGTASDRGDVYLDRILSAADWSDALTMAWLKKTLIEQGIKIEEN